MHHYHAGLQGIELVTGISYFMILSGFALRTMVEGRRAQLLWPWALIAIFGLCGITRLNYVGVLDLPLMGWSHFILSGVALAYGAGQLIYAVYPEIFEVDAPLPKLQKDPAMEVDI